jgi:hypothetical protein
VPLTKLNLLGNLPQPGIFKQLRQEVLGEHSSVAKCGQRRSAQRVDEVAASSHGRCRANQGRYRLKILSIMPEVDWPFSYGRDVTVPPAASTSSGPTISVSPQSPPLTRTCGRTD